MLRGGDKLLTYYINTTEKEPVRQNIKKHHDLFHDICDIFTSAAVCAQSSTTSSVHSYWFRQAGLLHCRTDSVERSTKIKLRLSSSLSTFKKHLKSLLFSTAFTWQYHSSASVSSLQRCVWLVAWHSGRTSVSDRRTFAVLRSTCGWRVTTYVGKPSAVGQPTRPTQPFILSG